MREGKKAEGEIALDPRFMKEKEDGHEAD